MTSSHHIHEDALNRAKTTATASEDELFSVAGDVLTFIEQVLPSASKWVTPVIPFANTIPAVSGSILELHPAQQYNGVDFAARLNTSFDKELISTVTNRQCSLPFLPDGFPLPFTNKGNALRYGIENIWVEYDAPFGNSPAIFFDINKNKPFQPLAVYEALLRITNEMDYRIEKDVFSFLQQISRLGLSVVYYGLMFSRNSPSLRLTVNGIDADNLTNVLTVLGWKGNMLALQETKSMYLCKKQKLVVGVDVNNGLLSRIGIEVFDENKKDFIKKLHSYRHISDEQEAMLNSWERTFILPTYLRTALSELHHRNVRKLHTRINHFKLIHDDANAITAKVYLYYCF